MIYGRLIEGKPTVPVVFRLTAQPDFSMSFVIDTEASD
jgi:predicted aspartyl protease